MSLLFLVGVSRHNLGNTVEDAMKWPFRLVALIFV